MACWSRNRHEYWAIIGNMAWQRNISTEHREGLESCFTAQSLHTGEHEEARDAGVQGLYDDLLYARPAILYTLLQFTCYYADR